MSNVATVRLLEAGISGLYVFVQTTGVERIVSAVLPMAEDLTVSTLPYCLLAISSAAPVLHLYVVY